MELLKDYDVTIQYHPGKANVVVDSLSQNVVRDPVLEWKDNAMMPRGMYFSFRKRKAIPLYRMALAKLKELKEHLKDLLDKGKCNTVAYALSRLSIDSLAYMSPTQRELAIYVLKLVSLGVRLMDSEVGATVALNMAEPSGVTSAKEGQYDDPLFHRYKEGFWQHRVTTFELLGECNLTSRDGQAECTIQMIEDMVSPMKGVMRFRKKGEPSHVIPRDDIGITKDLSFEEVSVAILDR
ncbi:hypothetical protein MTR67_018349 [Solanum verrucosum]|uniref:Uncharacterized protein n=1 Tax=Solanum verrucosum TaxID=315347 RepID=A0AAF0QS14_SOLVR|nr:hypothetical protein MTR67_018349 [Solanum verrucosum]